MEEVLTLNSEYKTFFQLPEEQTAADYIIRKCRHSLAEHPCIRNPVSGETIQYAEVEPFSRNVASFLLANGFAPGDVVINVSHDGENLHVFFIGVWRVGGVIQCFYPDDIGPPLTDLIVSSKPKYILCDSKDYEACLHAVAASGDGKSVQVVTFGKSDDDNCGSMIHVFRTKQHNSYDFSAIRVSRQDVALLLPTSGTTGKSKYIVYTHETLLRNVVLFENFPFTDDPSAPTLITGRQTHFTGSVCPLAFFAAGRYLLMMRDVNQENILRAIEKYKVRSIFSFPSYLTGLVEHPSAPKYDTKSLRFAFTAGMVVGSTFFLTLEKLGLANVVTIYGMTEVGFLTANVEWKKIDGKIVGSLAGRNVNAGKLPPGGSLMVRDIETGKLVGAGKRGELCFRNDLVCSGYWRNQEASGQTFQDGWISTGDLGYFDEEGNIFVLNRIKDVFKYYNNHITPSDLENVILEHPSVEEACIVGVPDPAGGGTVPRAFVKLREPGDTLLAENILQWINEGVSDYKKLRGGLQVLDALPKGKSGKVLRNALTPIKIPCLPAPEPSYATPISD